MKRPGKFEHFRYVADKRTLTVYDIDELSDESAPIIDELMEAGTFLSFGPDTEAEARNRGFKLYQEPKR